MAEGKNARAEAQDALTDPGLRLRLALAAADMGDWSWNAATDLVTMSERAASMFGIEPGERMTWADMRGHIHPDDAEAARIAVEAAVAERRDYGIDYRVLHDGHYDRWISARGTPLYDLAGAPRGMVGVVQDVTERKQLEGALQRRTEHLQSLNQAALSITGEFDLSRLVQQVTDIGVRQTGAAFGAFFYNVVDPSGSSYVLYSLSGVDRSHFEKFPMPRATPLFAPTFEGRGVVRIADVRKDPRYGQWGPHHGMPKGHLPVVSYLAVPVIGRSGEVLGGLFFGHPEPGVFTEETELFILGLSAQAAVAIDNSRLYDAVSSNRDVLSLAMRGGKMGAWSRRLSDDKVWWSRELEEIFGLDPGQFAGKEKDFLGFVHPDDLDTVIDAVRQSVEGGGDYEVEFRFRHASGAWRWMDGRGRTVFGADGEPVMLYGLGIDITDRMNAMIRLREADIKKNEFLAVLAHELRNPLAPIRNSVEILRHFSAANPLVENASAMIGRQVTHLVRLVDDLLDVSRITRGQLNLQKQWTPLSAVVASAVEVARPHIDAQGHVFEVELPPHPVYLYGDLTRLAQVVQNLLNNAAKYTPRGGHIRLEAALDGNQLSLRVSDDGIGIPADMLDSIFGMFMQVDRSIERSTGGLGIGLTLVERIVALHNGTVEAQSSGPGHGSVFTLRLPASLSASVAAAEQAAAPVAPSMFRRILVVDDNRDSADSLAALLRFKGHEVSAVHDGTAALDAVRTFAPDVVLLDLGLPRMSGYEVARRIRAQQGNQTLLLVAITGWGQAEDRRRSKDAGFNYHLVKPVSVEDLDPILAH